MCILNEFLALLDDDSEGGVGSLRIEQKKEPLL
jgi:hypothetical protein